VFCPKCGHPNDNDAKFCTNCGTPLAAAEGGTSPAGTATPEEFYKAYIGPSNQFYYLQRFKRFDEAGKAGVTWNWPAFFITFYWFLYRKMWVPALLYFLAPYLLMFAVGFVVALFKHGEDLAVGVFYLLYLIGVWIVVPMYANALYYQHSRKRIAEVRAHSNDIQRTLGELSGKGGTSYVPVIILGVFGVIAVIGILAAIAIPQYQQFVVRSQVNQAVTTGRQAAESVATYYYRNQMLPATLGEAGFAGTLPPSVKAISVDNQTGVVTITMANGAIAGQTIEMVPSLDEQGRISWQCTSEEVKQIYLPAQCRQ
jgi:Tfp pilus assembly protein PilE